MALRGEGHRAATSIRRVRARTDAGRAELHLVLVRLHIGDDSLRLFDRQILARDQDARPDSDTRPDRLETAAELYTASCRAPAERVRAGISDQQC